MAYVIEPPVFDDRADAGRQLAERLREYRGRDVIVLSIPRGGVPVAVPISRELDAPLDVVVVRKLPAPAEPEHGFGAVTPDGTIIYNAVVMARLGLGDEDASALADRVREEARAEEVTYRQGRPAPDLRGKTVILVDDGVHTGFSMLAAIRSIRQQRPARLVVAIPVSPASALQQIAPLADDTVSLVVHRSPHRPFSIAEYYRQWSEPTDEEIVTLLSSG